MSLKLALTRWACTRRFGSFTYTPKGNYHQLNIGERTFIAYSEIEVWMMAQGLGE